MGCCLIGYVVQHGRLRFDALMPIPFSPSLMIYPSGKVLLSRHAPPGSLSGRSECPLGRLNPNQIGKVPRDSTETRLGHSQSTSMFLT